MLFSLPFIYIIPLHLKCLYKYIYHYVTVITNLQSRLPSIPIIHKHKNTSGAASVTVTVDLPKIYLFDVEINENIFQIKEKGKKQVGTFADKFGRNPHQRSREKFVPQKV